MEWCEGPPHSSFNLSLSSLFVEVNERGEVEFVVEGSGGRGVFVVGSEYDFELWEEATGRRDKVRFVDCFWLLFGVLLKFPWELCC